MPSKKVQSKVQAFEKVEAKVQALGKVQTKVQAFEKSASKSASHWKRWKQKCKPKKKCKQKCKPSKRVQAKVQTFQKSCKELHSWLITWTLWSRFVRGTPELPERNLETWEVLGGRPNQKATKVQSGNLAFCRRLAQKATGLQLQGTNLWTENFPGGRPSQKRQGYNCNLEAWNFPGGATGLQLQFGNLKFSWRQARSQSQGHWATTAIWELEIFLAAGPVRRRQRYNYNLGTSNFPGGRPSQKATGLQLQSGNLKFAWRQAQSEGNRATTRIWELEIFLAADPVRRRQGYNYNLGTWNFPGGRAGQKATGLQLQSGNLKFSWRQAQSEGDRATTTIWELEIFLAAGPITRRQGYNYNLGTCICLAAGPVRRRQGYNCNLGTWNFPAAGPATGLQLQSGNLKYSWRQAQSEGDRATTTIWELEIFLAAGPVRRQQGYN